MHNFIEATLSNYSNKYVKHHTSHKVKEKSKIHTFMYHEGMYFDTRRLLKLLWNRNEYLVVTMFWNPKEIAALSPTYSIPRNRLFYGWEDLSLLILRWPDKLV